MTIPSSPLLFSTSAMILPGCASRLPEFPPGFTARAIPPRDERPSQVSYEAMTTVLFISKYAKELSGAYEHLLAARARTYLFSSLSNSYLKQSRA